MRCLDSGVCGDGTERIKTKIHHGDGVSRRKIGERQSQKQKQNQNPRTAENTEKVHGRMEIDKNLREKRRFQRLVTRRKIKDRFLNQSWGSAAVTVARTGMVAGAGGTRFVPGSGAGTRRTRAVATIRA